MKTKLKQIECSPKCPYFYNPYDINDIWVYNEKRNSKMFLEKKPFVCKFDGHNIVSWFDSCPKKEEKGEK